MLNLTLLSMHTKQVKLPNLLPTYASQSELPSNTCTMVPLNNQQMHEIHFDDSRRNALEDSMHDKNNALYTLRFFFLIFVK